MKRTGGPASPRGGRIARRAGSAALLAVLLLLSCAAPRPVRKEPVIAPSEPPKAARAPEGVPSPPSPPPEEGRPLVPPGTAVPSAPVLAVPPPVPPIPSAVEEAVDPEALLPAEHPVRLPSDPGGKEAAPPPVPPEAPSQGTPGGPSHPSRDGKEPRVAAAAKPHPAHPPEAPREDRKKGKAPPAAPAVAPPRPWETEDLSFQVRYLGVPCGYARFRSLGRVRLGGREAVHLQVRGWTSKLLSVVYPLDTTMDYYLDPATLLPLRIDQRKTERGRYKSSIATYDQEKGEITYWKPETGRMEKRVRTVPSVHDPVTVVYNIRTLDPGTPQAPRHVYAGRKVWQVQPRKLGQESVPDELGRPVETVVLAPLIRREGQEESKGDIRVWISRDARHAPLRIYASIRLGTVEGRLIPTPAGGP